MADFLAPTAARAAPDPVVAVPAEPPAPVAALSGATTAEIQRVLAAFAERRRSEGFRIAGVVEESEGCAEGCERLTLRCLTTGERVSISQNLGRESTACNLDSSGLAAACGLVQAAIAAGADLVILSKFGKIEADRHGLTEAFQAAIAAELPVVTSVAPTLAEPWDAFAGPLAVAVSADDAALDAWWQALRAAAASPAVV